jgi:hypothetical protein
MDSYIFQYFDEAEEELVMVCLICGASASAMADGTEEEIEVALDHLPTCEMMLVKCRLEGN